MKLDLIDLGKLSVSKANMRYAKKAPDVSDILPTVRARGVLVPVIVRATCEPDAFEIVAGARRFHAAQIVAEERRAEGHQADPLPCAILGAGDDAAAIEVSLIENVARLDPDEVSRWETFARLIKEGRAPADIAATFGLPDLAVKRVLALGNLMPRIRDLYRKAEIDTATVRLLTLASKAQQRDWLALRDDPKAYAPTGQTLRAWLCGGQSIKACHALFDIEVAGCATVSDLFGEDSYFADPGAFWTAQNAAIEAKRAEYLEAGWSGVVIVGAGANTGAKGGEHFHSWQYEKAAKRKGGLVYVDVHGNGEVSFHEGYVTRAEARRAERSETATSGAKPSRPEVTGPMQIYLDLHRHAAVRAAMTGHPGLALRLMVAHAVVGSPLWTVRPEPQSARNDAICESIENAQAEALFDAKRRAVLALLDFSAEEPTVAGGNGNGNGFGLVGVFLRLLALTEAEVLDVVTVVMGETLAAGSAAVEAVGSEIGIDMACYWEADDAFFALLRDREVLAALVGEVAGKVIADANAGGKGKVLKQIVRDHLGGEGGRNKVEGWVPRWMTFPPAAYTARGGVSTVEQAALADAARQGIEQREGVTSPPEDQPDEQKRFAA